jgi:hypothetical protein
MSSRPLIEAIRAHLAHVFPERALETLVWEEGGVVPNLPDLAVLRVAPAAGGTAWLHASAGASEPPMEDGYGIEFLLLAPSADKLATKLVAMVANLHADPRYPLSLGQVLEIGQPWLPGASADHLLVSLPTLFDPELEWLSDRERNVRFAWLVPITAREADFISRNGWDSFEDKLADQDPDLVDLQRPGLKV